mgnify:FL=1
MECVILQQTIFAMERTFSSGSRGFYGSGKVFDPTSGKRYQTSVTLVEIGSKPAADAKPAKPAK